jgi:hypothetical protein
MTTQLQTQSANPSDADRNITMLDLDAEYADWQRNEPMPIETPDLINGVTPAYWSALIGFSDEPDSEFVSSENLLGLLQQLESDYGLPTGTAERFKRHYEDASSVSETEELRYAVAWDAYHEALDSDDDMATLARLYGQHMRMPLFNRINAHGVFTF